MNLDSSSSKLRDLIPCRSNLQGISLRSLEYENLLLNQLKITRTDESTIDFNQENLIKRLLVESGVVGYSKSLDQWFQVAGEGVNEQGNPRTIRLITQNGRVQLSKEADYENKENGNYYIKGLPIPISFKQIIDYSCSFIDDCELAIRQNLDACKTPYIVVARDKDVRLSLEQALNQKQRGQAAIVVSEDLGEGLKGINISTNYLVDKMQMAQEQERDRLFNKLGIMTANTNKRERVQVGEVNATVGQCSDYVYMMIDTFNKQMEFYGIPYSMQINGSLEELYEENNGEDSNTEYLGENDD